LRDILFSPEGCVALTAAAYAAAQALHAKTRFFLFHPVLTSVAALIALLEIFGVPYEEYRVGGGYIMVFLGPAVVALGVPLYKEFGKVRREAVPALATTLFGSVVGLLSALIPALLWDLPAEAAISLAPKSVTTPIAMVIAEELGGLPSFSAAVVVSTGILGAVVGPVVLRLVGVADASAFGLAMGFAAHGVGTARAFEEGSDAGAFSSLGLCLNGIMTAVLTPLAVDLLL